MRGRAAAFFQLASGLNLYYATANIALLRDPSVFCAARPIVVGAAHYLANVSWNCYLLFLVVDANGMLHKTQADGSEVLVAELPLWVHWKKVLFIFVPTLGALRSLCICKSDWHCRLGSDALCAGA